MHFGKVSESDFQKGLRAPVSFSRESKSAGLSENFDRKSEIVKKTRTYCARNAIAAGCELDGLCRKVAAFSVVFISATAVFAGAVITVRYAQTHPNEILLSGYVVSSVAAGLTVLGLIYTCTRDS